MSKVPENLSESLDKSINSICPFSIGENSSQNHCAHYVSHMMNYQLGGVTCKNFTWDDKQKEGEGATLRVDDVFKNSSQTGVLSEKPATITECLIFVTLASNISTVGGKLVMGNHPRKHIGILTEGNVWNYSNTNNKVVCDSLSAFKAKFSNAYKTNGTTVEFYYGRFL